MNIERNRRLGCPTCGKTVLWTDDFPERPFCSKRCRLIDLGDWASENHRVPGEPLLPDAMDSLVSGDGGGWDK